MLDHQPDDVVGDAGAVFDAVDARLDQAWQGVLAEYVCGDSRPVVVDGGDRTLEDVVGPQRRQVAGCRGRSSRRPA